MTDNAKAMVLASFIGDALALGVHWVYNTNVIDKKYGRVTDMLAPKLASFHRGKTKGEFTHYGDQALVLLESIAVANGFDLDRFAQDWRSLFSNYEGYIDKATLATQEHFKTGKSAASSGSESDELGGPARIAPLVYWCRKDSDSLIEAVRSQTAMTHTGPEVVDAAEFFARTLLNVLNGDRPRSAMENVMNTHFNRAPLQEWIADGLDSETLETRAVIKDFGQMCEIPGAVPSTVHLIAKYEDNLEEALIENMMAGGDSAARGLMAGAVLGAYLGMEAIPPRWLDDLKVLDRIVSLLDQFSDD